MRILPLLALLAAACGSSEDHASPAAQAGKPALPVLADASQTALASDLDAARVRGTWVEVKRRWQGQQVRWVVTRQRSLCRSADACFVAAFPVRDGAKHGWMPQLGFAPGQFALLESTCGTLEQCRITIEGTLDRLEASSEMPTNVRFSNVVLDTTVAQR